MSNTFEQLPSTLNLAFRQGDEFGALLDFSNDLTGYTVAAELQSVVSGQQVVAMTTTLVNASTGTVNVSLTETQTAALPAGTYRWTFYWDAPGNVRRTILTGHVEVTR